MDNKNNKKQLFVVLDNVRSAYNVGSVFRICDCAGVDALYLTGITPYPPHNKIPKTSLGAEETVYWEYHRDAVELVKLLQSGEVKKARKSAIHKSEHLRPKLIDEKLQIVSLEITKDSKNLFSIKFNKSLALVFGHELSGVNKEILKLSDKIIHIPMLGQKESLNVSTSAGIAVYEVQRGVLQ